MITIKTKNGPVKIPNVEIKIIDIDQVPAIIPNSVPSDQMALLEISILADGFCYSINPVDTRWDSDNKKYIIYAHLKSLEEGQDEEKRNKEKTKNKITYTCSCGQNVWGKPGLKLFCDVCKSSFKEEEYLSE